MGGPSKFNPRALAREPTPPQNFRLPRGSLTTKKRGSEDRSPATQNFRHSRQGENPVALARSQNPKLPRAAPNFPSKNGTRVGAGEGVGAGVGGVGVGAGVGS